MLHVRSTNILVLLLGGEMPAIHSPAWDGGGGCLLDNPQPGGGEGGASALTNSVEILVARYQQNSMRTRNLNFHAIC